MSRRQRRAAGRVEKKGGGVRKKVPKSASRAEKRRTHAIARRALAEAARSRAPRHVTVLPACAAARAVASETAKRIADSAKCVVRATSEGIVSALDELKTADAMLVLFASTDEELDDVAHAQIAAIRAQGLPQVFVAAIDKPAALKPLRRHRARVLEAQSLGLEAALRPVDITSAEGIALLARKLTAKAPKEVAWRARYGYLAVDKCNPAEDGVVIAGWLRGRGLSANELVHITGVGSFACRSIVDEKSGKVLSERIASEAEDPAQDAVPDENMGEQTWIPEMDAGGGEFFAEGEEDDFAESEEDDGSGMSDGEESDGAGGMDLETLLKEQAHRTGNEIDDEDEGDEMEVDEDAVRQLRETANTDAKFPDEVDTPMDQAARLRFARYRGLKSFRTSEWDPKEQLPREYARLFQFRNLKATRKRVLAQANAIASKKSVPNFAKPGSRVLLHLTGLRETDMAKISAILTKGENLVASGMLKHENKRSVVHFGVTRVDEENPDDAPIKAKAPMQMHSGFVRFDGRPMFSEHNSNSDKHKMNRFLMHDRYTVASFYGPCVYAPAPALLFHSDGRFIAAGSCLGADPDRIILKRIVLTGYPFKTQKRKSVAKFMFFNADDIRWFKPVELWTKMGRTGHILEPMGTHGHMKCIFDAAILHHDTICMTLYKRVYPKHIVSPYGDA